MAGNPATVGTLESGGDTFKLLGTIEEEAAACRKRFEGSSPGDIVVHCHHDALCEPLIDAEKRISYILIFKAPSEQALRLRLFSPVSKKFKDSTEWVKAIDEWSQAGEVIQHDDICPLGPDCPWNGKTIFREEDHA